MTHLHCSLETLPPELLLPILTYLPDLESLDSLLRASPAAYHVIDSRGAIVFQAVLSSGSNHTYTRALIRIIALIRADALPSTVHDLVSFKDLVRHETSPHRWEPPRWVDPPTSLSSDIPSTVLRGLLVTHRMIQRLTFGCLEYYLDRFRALRPSNSAEFSYDSMRFAKIYPHLIGPCQEKPANTLYYFPIHDVGPPSWLEQQRVLRAFWRIQLSRDLNATVDASRIFWPDEEGFEGVNRMSAAELCNAPSIFWDDAGGHLVGHRELMRWETLLEHELLESAIQYTQEVQKVVTELTAWRLKKDWAAAPMQPNQEDWYLLDLTFTSNMWSYFNCLSGDFWLHETRFISQLQHVKFDSFRRFGFAIWSTARMAAYGLLLPQDEYSGGLHPPYYEAWRNLLTQDERDAVDTENERRDEEALNGSIAS